jgi:SAM-dependent methyltransferase
MSSADLWDEESALRYDEASAFMFAPDVLDPAVDLLAELAGPGPVLELAIGTGRVAIPLHERGLEVCGIELSQPMTDALHRKSPDLPVTVGDMATADAPLPGPFSLAYVVWNSIANVRTQEEQAAVFANASRHLAPGGRFVLELWIPPLRRLPPGQLAAPFHVGERHTGLDTYDLVTQQGTSPHYSTQDDGSIRYGSSNFRYLWPSECDLMARLAGMTLEDRWQDFRRTPFTSDSENQVAVYRLS